MDSGNEISPLLKSSSHKPRPTKKFWLFSVVATILIVSIAGILLMRQETEGHLTVPPTIAQRAKSAIYLPSKLPGNYTIEESSFSIQEDEVILFKATDGVDGRIVFTEQARPKEFDFDSFYNSEMKDPKTLEGTPFISVLGKTKDDKTQFMSVVTDETWLLISTQSPISEENFLSIARSLQLVH